MRDFTTQLSKMMKNVANVAILLSGILLLPLTIHAKPQQADTIGTKIIHTYQITQTVTYIEQTTDSLISSDDTLQHDKITVYTRDTLKRIDTTEKIDTNYIQAPLPLSFWKLGSESSIGINQVALLNWAGGGQSSVSILLSNKSFAEYKRGFSTWRTTFEMKYGQQRQQAQIGDELKSKWFKNNDQLKLNSIYGFKASTVWYYSASVDFSTQLTNGYASVADQYDSKPKKYASRSFLPFRSTFSIGMEYANVPNTVFLYLSPIAYKLTYVWDTTLSRNYGVPANERFLTQFGPMAKLINKHKLTPTVSIESTLNLLADMLNMQEHFISLEWNFGLSFSVTQNLKLKVLTDLIYDPKVKFDLDKIPGGKRKVQFRESLILNFTYRITN